MVEISGDHQYKFHCNRSTTHHILRSTDKE